MRHEEIQGSHPAPTHPAPACSTIFYYPRQYIALIDQLKRDIVSGRSDAADLLPNIYVGVSTNVSHACVAGKQLRKGGAQQQLGWVMGALLAQPPPPPTIFTSL